MTQRRSSLKIQYHLPILPPVDPEVEAYSQEIRALQSRFEGQVNFLNPNQHLPGAVRKMLPLLRVPRVLFGFHQLGALRQMDEEVDLHHFYNPDPFAYPILRRLKKPVIYVLSGGSGPRKPNVDFFNAMGAVVVYDDRSAQQLQAWGVENVAVARTGIDTQKFTHVPLAAPTMAESTMAEPTMTESTMRGPTVHLLMASAPWSEEQFESKGVDALLAAARELPNLHLTFLWRGVLYDAMMQRVAAAGLRDRVRVIDEVADVNALLATVHGSVLLAARSDIVKAYPHSLLDSLAAGKPVLVSPTLALADYVVEKDVGTAVDAVTVESVIAGVRSFVDRYAQFAENALLFGQRDFSQDAMLDSYEAIYVQVLGEFRK